MRKKKKEEGAFFLCFFASLRRHCTTDGHNVSVSGERRRWGRPGRVGRREIVLATRSRLFETTEAADNGQWPLNRMEDLLLCISRAESAGCS
jgi:hypothetical protein